MINVKLNGTSAFKKKLKAKTKYVKEITDQEINKGCQYIEVSMKADTPVKTGILRSSEGYKKIKDMEYEVFAAAEYAADVEARQKAKGESFFEANVERGKEIINRSIKSKLKI